MQKSSSSFFAGASHGIRCPHCGGRAHRIERRLVDRIVSLFVAVRRYWCYECRWQGNLRAAHVVPFGRDATPSDSGSLAAALDRLRARRAEAVEAAAPEARPRALAVAGRGLAQQAAGPAGQAGAKPSNLQAPINYERR